MAPAPGFSVPASASAAGAAMIAAINPVMAGTKIRATRVDTFLLMIRPKTKMMVIKPKNANIYFPS